MFEHILNNQMGNFDMEARNKSIENYHKNHPYKCPKCGNEHIGITYTTGTGACSNCKSALMLTTRGIVANQRASKPNNAYGPCHLYFEDGTELKCDNESCDLGPVFCGKVEHIYL